MHRGEISSMSSLDVSFKNVVDYIVIVFYFFCFFFTVNQLQALEFTLSGHNYPVYPYNMHLIAYADMLRIFIESSILCFQFALVFIEQKCEK